MKRTLPLVVLLLLAADPYRVPQNEARQYAKLCVAQTTLTDVQIATGRGRRQSMRRAHAPPHPEEIGTARLIEMTP